MLAAGPDILAHNVETVPGSTHRCGGGRIPALSHLLQQAKEISPEVITKSGLMLGLGEGDRRSE